MPESRLDQKQPHAYMVSSFIFGVFLQSQRDARWTNALAWLTFPGRLATLAP